MMLKDPLEQTKLISFFENPNKKQALNWSNNKINNLFFYNLLTTETFL